VRAIFGISCLLLGVAMLLCQVEGSYQTEGAEPRAAVRWVRTAHGWERTDRWYLEVTERPTLHPLVVSAGQGLLSVLGLALFQRDDR
jgi:hypothetical protein